MAKMLISNRDGLARQNGNRFIVLGHKGYVRLGNLDLDFKIRISDLKSNAKSENGFKR